VGRDLGKRLGAYVELVAVTGAAGEASWQAQADGGVTYAIGNNLQFDAGCNVGVASSAPDWNPFVGLPWRF
jgi:hypothetical protein